MSELIKGIRPDPECGFPKAARELLATVQCAAFDSDTIPDSGGEPFLKSNKITEYKKIEPWQNYFLCSAVCSVGLKLGSEIEDYHFYANFTGDNFTYLYAAEKGNPNNVQCDSGVTNYFFVPELVKRAYAAFGYSCIYISNAQMKKDFHAVMNAIKSSVDKGVPVLTLGLENPPKGADWWVGYKGLLGEGSLIGGYGENDVLYVNLYNTQGKPDIDEYGYSTITRESFENAKGLFFAGEPIEKPDRREMYRSVIDSIPAFLALPPAENESGRYAFGKAAFEVWADTLEEDSFFENKPDEELGGILWNLHCSPYCCVCTSSAAEFLREAAGQYPDLEMAVRLAPLYSKMQRYKDDIWALQGGFEPPLDKFRTHGFRGQIAAVLRKMGGVCDEILDAFSTL